MHSVFEALSNEQSSYAIELKYLDTNHLIFLIKVFFLLAVHFVDFVCNTLMMI